MFYAWGAVAAVEAGGKFKKFGEKLKLRKLKKCRGRFKLFFSLGAVEAEGGKLKTESLRKKSFFFEVD